MTWADEDPEQVTDGEDLEFPWWTYRVIYALVGLASVTIVAAGLIVAGGR